MKIPNDDSEREAFYSELVSNCLVSQNDRKASYEILRYYYLFGCDPSANQAEFNKIQSSIDLLSSFLYASETTKFTINLGPEVHESEFGKLNKLGEAINGEWFDSNADVIAGQAVIWALVYNTAFVKLVVQSEPGFSILPFMVEPHQIGVLREDVPFLDRQEAIVQCYDITRSELERILENHPNKENILYRVSASRKSQNNAQDGVSRLIISSFAGQGLGGTMVGNLNGPFNSSNTYRPRVAEELISMQELWVWNDEISDYQTVTMADGDVCIFDRENIFVKGEHPFIQFCPNPMYDYLWGTSEVEKMTKLQDWRTARMRQISSLLDRALDPPTSLTGWNGIPDEMNFALNRAGGVLASQEMTAKVERFAPQIPQDTFAEIREIDQMFSDTTGLTNVVSGRGESGVRSKGHASELARLGSSRAKKRAMIIEDSLEKMATLYLKLMRCYDTKIYKDESGLKFSAEQFTTDFTVKVDAHSNSPIFVEDHKALAEELFKAHAIDRETLIDLLQPPMAQLLKERLKKIEKKEAEAQKAQHEAEAQKDQKQLKSVK